MTDASRAAAASFEASAGGEAEASVRSGCRTKVDGSTHRSLRKTYGTEYLGGGDQISGSGKPQRQPPIAHFYAVLKRLRTSGIRIDVGRGCRVVVDALRSYIIPIEQRHGLNTNATVSTTCLL